jgi:hypothetical protein
MSGNYAESVKWYNKYFAIVDNATQLPVQQSKPIAQYNQGYNNLKLGDYVEAQKNLKEPSREYKISR